MISETGREFELLFTASNANSVIASPAAVVEFSCVVYLHVIHRECNHGSTRSTRPITVHERTAICRSQLEPIIENPSNKLLVADSQTDYIGV